VSTSDEPDVVGDLIDRILWHSGTPGCGPDAAILTCQYCIDLKAAGNGGRS
jgi:hypothetical protein